MFAQTTTALLLAVCLTQALPRYVELCPSIGHYLLPDDSDCSKFYYCEYGRRRRDVSSCAPGTVFSVEYQVCVHPSQSNCRLQTPIHDDDHINQNIDDNENYPFQLDDRFSADIATVQVCDSPANVNCIISDNSVGQLQQENSEHTDDSELEGDSNNSESQDTSLQPADDIFINFENQNANPQETENNFEENYQEGDDIIINFENHNALTNPGDTVNNLQEKYEEEDEVIINFENNHFNTNPEEIVNNFEENVDDEVEKQTIKLENGCPSDFRIHYTEPHETDCDKYYLCNFGKRILRECGPGNWYDNKLLICTWPHLANCANSETPNNERSLNKRWNQWRSW